MKKVTFISLTLIFIISSCAIVTDEYQVNNRKLLSYLLEDLPMPKNSKILKAPTMLLGTGDAISGRIKISSPDSPAENLIFYESELPAIGWMLRSSRVGETITLIYSKNQRYVTFDITPQMNLISFMKGDYASDIEISIVNPDTKMIQSPYELGD
jgi:hypothetical protein